MPAGSGAYLGFGYEKGEGIPGPITSYMPFQTESLNPKWGRKPNPNINPRRSAQKTRLLNVEIKGSTKNAPDVESSARLRACQHGKVGTTELDIPNTVYQHVMSQLMSTDPPEAVYRRTLSGIVYRDDGVPMLVTGGVVTKVSLAIKDNEFVEETHDLMFANTTESRQPLPAAGNNVAFTGFAAVRGVRRDPESLTPVWARVTRTGALDGTSPKPGMSFKLGGLTPTDVGFAAEFGPDIYDVVNDGWMDVWDGTTPPVPMGVSLTNPLQVLFHTDVPADVLTVGDVFKIEARIPVVSPSYSTREPYDFGQAVALLDGKRYTWKTAMVEGITPLVENRGLGSYFMQNALNDGETQWNVTLERNYEDRDFVNALKAGKVSSMVLTLMGDRIGTSAYRDSKTIVIAAAQYDDAGTAVANSKALQEKVVLKGIDNHTDPIAVETLVNTIPVI